MKGNVREFPYMMTRLQDIDYEKIIEIGEPWNDPHFPHGPQALFIDGFMHQTHDHWVYDEEVDPASG